MCRLNWSGMAACAYGRFDISCLSREFQPPVADVSIVFFMQPPRVPASAKPMIDNTILRVLISCLLFRPPAPPRPRNFVNPNSPYGGVDASRLAASAVRSWPSVAGKPQCSTAPWKTAVLSDQQFRSPSIHLGD